MVLSLHTNADLKRFFRLYFPLGCNVLVPSVYLAGNSSMASGCGGLVGGGGCGGWSSYTPRENANLNILRTSSGEGLGFLHSSK